LRKRHDRLERQWGAVDIVAANTVSGHDFVPQEILDSLVSMGLVYWRTSDDVNLTATGERTYETLAAEISAIRCP
jgi:hypothetical protein